MAVSIVSAGNMLTRPTIVARPVIASRPLSQLSTATYLIEPLRDRRWSRFLTCHPRASVFHSLEWLEALRRTYGYQPFALTTCPRDEELTNALVFCRIESGLTGRRLVALPFSDHCEPLLNSGDDPQVFASALEREAKEGSFRYIELRPLSSFNIRTGLIRTQVNYRFHQLDLSGPLSTLFNNFHVDSIQRKIRRAERDRLAYEEGRSQQFLDTFYRLFKITRQRHHVPPPPKQWFRNLIDCFGDMLKIRIAAKGGNAVAAMLTLRYKNTLVYKYGCSDSRFNRFGGTHLLFWNSIQEAKGQGLYAFDFGRSDDSQSGLITFKSRWGATESALVYSRYAALGSSTHFFDLPVGDWKSQAAKRILRRLPSGTLSMIGSYLYKHVG